MKRQYPFLTKCIEEVISVALTLSERKKEIKKEMEDKITKITETLLKVRKGALIISEVNMLSKKLEKYAKRYFGKSCIIRPSYIETNIEKEYFIQLVKKMKPKLIFDLTFSNENYLVDLDDITEIKFTSKKKKEKKSDIYIENKIVGFCDYQNKKFIFKDDTHKSIEINLLPKDDYIIADKLFNELCKQISMNFPKEDYDISYSSLDEVEKVLMNQKFCSVKYLYKSKPNLTVDSINIAEFRISMGEALAMQCNKRMLEKIDYIVPVPNSGNFYAVGFSKATGIPYLPALSKVDVSERAFEIQDVSMRRSYLIKNMSVNSDLIREKNILLIDEAIFTGATLKSVCELVGEAGAKTVNIAIPSPQCFKACQNYVQPERELLLSKVRSSAVARYFNVESVTYLSEKTYRDQISSFKGDNNFCMTCFE